MKLIEADMKRMSGLLVSYEEQKPDMKADEKQDRVLVIKLLKEALRLLRDDFEQQTRQFEMGGGFRQALAPMSRYKDDPMTTVLTESSLISHSINVSANV